ncbi:MAG: hypothetical protein HZA50_11650 [Planctomycetes bacterium]|nr:hypothetical protein [Planctomycetota bacterium]
MSALPGMGTAKTATVRDVLLGSQARYLPQGKIIHGAAARDPGNTGYLDILRAGLVMGKITATGAYRPSIYGITDAALADAGTACSSVAATWTEVARDVGSAVSGTFKFTGPPVTGGTVRTMTATYSGLAGTLATITALGQAEIQTITFGTGGAGSFQLSFRAAGAEAAQITGTQDAATAAEGTNTAAAFTSLGNVGTSNCTASWNGTSVLTLTFGGTLSGPQDLIEVQNNTLNNGTNGAVPVIAARTQTGVDGRFVSGSLVQPTDGAEAPLTVLSDRYGKKVTDDDGADIDIQYPDVLMDAILDASKVVNYSSMAAGVQTWLKLQLKASALLAFSDDF